MFAAETGQVKSFQTTKTADMNREEFNKFELACWSMH